MIRKVCLYLVIIFGTIGGLLVCLWMWYNRKHRSRVNALIFNLCLADMLVVFVACLPQLVWEHMEREWLAGDFMCKTYKFCMSFSLFASNNMLVVIAIDRHQAIRSPLKEPTPVWLLSLCGWGIAAVASIPLFFVFHVRYHPVKQIMVCENTFRGKPMIHRQAFLTYVAIVSFILPLIILIICYIRIFLKIAQKAAESKNSKRQSFKPGKIHLTSTANTSLPKAKIKTLKMTVVIVAAYIICALPYFVAEMIMSFGDFHIISGALYGILGSMAAANSAANPFVFLLFNANWQCIRGLKLCPSQNNTGKRSFVYSSASTRSEYSTVYIRSPPFISTDSYELTTVRGSSRS
ncbi:hypothetical protein LOTGIDRAFT_118408 [Lottia gigantea]|uniref:G-protein coupled receptors family 1 profile domain-containing protein n=1 Tax=Lottia gigantea TaxID=225164 RepID=V4ALV9_LOTGI|nr:hypothetical protein LOTGIDRAFT_118408 [Lottia gigantea]ESO94581.1 hypothetical protein LOTGIDRAFT_118408 [Lottia gigantea]